MAFSKNQRESSLPVNNQDKRKASDFLPKFFRTETNQKFLGATLDQLISEGEVDKINAYIGRKHVSTYKSDDRYINDVSADRENYQLEPALVIRDSLNNVSYFKDYNDYINQLKFFNANCDDHSVLNSQEYYSWQPHYDWDKLVNYREYYWLPTGPQVISISGQADNITSTYTVRLSDDGNNQAYLFTPDGLTRNPSLRLYRGQTYRFEIDCPKHPIAFSTTRTYIPTQSLIVSTNEGIVTGGPYDVKTFDSIAYDLGGWIYNEDYDTEDRTGGAFYDVWTQGVVSDTAFVEKGIIEFTIPQDAPNILYYVSKNDINTGGIFKIYDIKESTSIDVEQEIIGKKTYTMQEEISLSNGMKVNFIGQVTPEKYATGNWYVEGVGNRIRLIAEKDLEIPAIFTTNEAIEFDNENFDTQGFDVNNNFPELKDYITINRASKDRNTWSRYNRWFHKEVIEISAALNGQTVSLDQTARAIRPIIEFNEGLQLFNHGKQAKENVDLIDTFTSDVFSTVEGSLGYNVDGVQLVPGMRILFTADPDLRVNGRIFKVGTLNHLDITRITLLEETDTDPVEGETVLVLQGADNRGKMFHYLNNKWAEAQAKHAINQAPLFDAFDINGNSFSDTSVYLGTTFKGTTIFGYKAGTTYDSELGLYISYKNIENIGDIEFEFKLHTDVVEYQSTLSIETVQLDTGFLNVNDGLLSTAVVNGWVTAVVDSIQPVVRQYVATDDLVFFKIDMYDKSANLTDLTILVFVNGVKQTMFDYEIYKQDQEAYIRFFNDLTYGDSVIIECESSAKKNANGFYKFPLNLEHNPQNLSVDSVTLGEIINHAQTITNNLTQFYGTTPGVGNLRDLGSVASYGTRIIQHSAPLATVAYHITDKKFNIVKSLRYAKDEYNKFKRSLIRVATDYGFDGETDVHLDLLLKELTKEHTKDSAFYFSDMLPFGANFVFSQTVLDNAIIDYPLTFEFDLTKPSEKSVMVYLNGELLLHGSQYVFVNDSFVRILEPITRNDDLKIVQYTSTDGCFVPPTPSKLGLYPVYEPKMYVDTSYQEPTLVIQGHDGSIVVAYNDYRDTILMEFEKRIYNNIKMAYNTDLFDIADYMPGFSRESNIPPEDLNVALRQEFLKWTSFINSDYTSQSFFDRNNPFTFNYNSFVDENNKELPGFWRGIFKYFYDTDRPNLCPWEMLGFTEEPLWWQSVYGPAPYTSDNLILWSDLEQGLVKEPGKAVVRREKYVRPNLMHRIPVSPSGGILPPIEANIVKGYISTSTQASFKFGDVAPIESSWRRSSDYPFALITALTLLRPAKMFAICFDRVRQFRNQTGQIIYNTDRGHLRFNSKDLITPNTSTDQTRVFASGLVNYIVDYATSLASGANAEYKSNLENLEVRLASKLGGFATKEKFKLILDSRSPLNNGNVFVPEENYQIALNTSSPVLSISYSGIMIEKKEGAFVVRGYNQNVPEFKWYQPLTTASDPVINVGGISQPYVEWDTNKYYNKGSIVRYDQQYYRTTTGHESSSVFELKYFAKLASLPVEGGRDIILRKNYQSNVSTTHYGAEFKTVQDVVDFILGYGEYLKAAGFNFEYYNPVLETVTNWQTAVKEFAFWTTQNWASGSIISISPAADELNFKKDYCVVDNIYDGFYDYSVYRENGSAILPSYINGLRENNNYVLRSTSEVDGIYHATLNLVQKEHILILDNTTVFNDVIYDQIQGYRQDRIKVLGYRTSNWQGDFNIPGFIYDRATVSDWTSWHDYSLGETVKYKEFYYSAKKSVPGSEKFDYNLWFKLDAKPTSRLLPNWDYRANQFADFYDLDSDSFDVDQQKFAQHLIGYQKRDYLENIINDDIAQYKFYQGMIQEKGVKSSLSKLFDALNSADKDSLEFFEEWAIRIGQYGGTAIFDEVEYLLDEQKFLINPQPIELVKTHDFTETDFIYRISQDETYLTSEHYNHTPFATTNMPVEYSATAGYVRPDDVKHIVKTKDEFTTFEIRTLNDGDYFWVGYDKNSWNVYRFSIFEKRIESLQLTNVLRINLEKNLDSDIKVGEYVGISNTIKSVEGIYKVVAISQTYFEIEIPEGFNKDYIETINSNPILNLYKFSSQRVKSINELNRLSYKRNNTELVWVDGIDNQWRTWKYEDPFVRTTIPNTAANFGSVVAVSNDNLTMTVTSTNQILYYNRASQFVKWQIVDRLIPSYVELSPEYDTPYTFRNDSRYNTHKFGSQLLLNSTGKTLFVSAPGYVDGEYSGYVAKFVKDTNNYYQFERVITRNPIMYEGDIYIRTQEFGHRIGLYNNYLIIASKGDSTVRQDSTELKLSGAISIYNTITNSFGMNIRFEESEINNELVGVEVIDMSVSATGMIAVLLSVPTETGIVYKLNTIQAFDESNGLLDPQQSIVIPDIATSVAITPNGDSIAVGTPMHSEVSITQGSVTIYKNNNGIYEFDQKILSPTNQQSELFGFSVHFNNGSDQLVVHGQGGHQDFPATMDGGETTFDLGSTNFIDISKYIGSVRVFDKYETKYVYSTDLEVKDNLGIQYGSNIAVTDRIYVNDPASTKGAVYEFAATKKAWAEYRTPDPQVNLERIKSIFLYNVKSNELLTYLDFIDPVKGKILGIAEQELGFKTHYDPAVYAVGTDAVVVDAQANWQEKNVGRLWWDLSAIKFLNPYQGSILYKSNTWNSTFAGSSVNIYEWVESEYSPSEWDQLADTEEGLTLGISGKSKYGDLAYCYKQRFDTITKTFKYVYYFWVKNKSVVPDAEFRKISAKDVAEYIADPKSKGIQYVTLLGSNQFALVNCKELMINSDIAINFRYWTIDKTDVNIHSHYQLLAEGDTSNKLNQSIEQKWFDSLIGTDKVGNIVPDPRLPAKLKYGVLARPRQGMFINRIEALKQVIERVNSVLIKTLLIDDYNFEILNSQEEAPTVASRLYDSVLDTYEEIRFIGTANIKTAELIPVVEDGRIKRVNIIKSGKGYGTIRPREYDSNNIPILWDGPTVTVNGIGIDADIRTVINAAGEVVSVIIENEGREYTQATSLIVRPYTVLVTADETATGKWTLNALNPAKQQWACEKIQTFNTTKYWRYENWYASGYNLFTKVDREFNFAYEIPLEEIDIGSVIKINYNGKGGWLMLEKVDNQRTIDLTINYKVIGRENGTIQFNSNLYYYKANNVGYDGLTYDTDFYDNQPKEELRIILNCIKNNLFIDELEIEYNKLFFASLRYVFSEQLFVDWAFKTSFVKSKHNLGELLQTPTFQPNNLENYESYINEVKPYRTKVREFISNFEKLENTNTSTTDFDLPARYNYDYKTIVPFQVKVEDGRIAYDSEEIFDQPNLDWYSNAGYQVIDTVVIDGGLGYRYAPIVEFVGACSKPAQATAYLSRGSVNKLVISDPGEGYLEVPQIILKGSFAIGGSPAKAIAISGNGLMRSMTVGMKFDRISPNSTTTELIVTETFTGTGAQSRFELKWPLDVSINATTITVNNEEKLYSEFKVYNEIDKTASYTRYKGIIEFATPAITVPTGSTIVVEYKKDIRLLDAADRIIHYYTAGSGKVGKDLGQLMTGVDYGGVELTGLKFDVGAGWDALPWQTGSWDNYDPNYTDHLARFETPLEEIDRTFTLPYVPEPNEVITVYLNNVRIDDPDFSTGSATNPAALMQSFIGDGSTNTIILPEAATYVAKNVVIFRKATSDGSFMPAATTYDTELVGGDFLHTTAAGLNAADITVDGDNFITPTTSYAPEEVVPGKISDALEISVYHRLEGGVPVIDTKYYTVTDTAQIIYGFDNQIGTVDSIFVRINNNLKIRNVDYTIDVQNREITISSTLSNGDLIAITSMGPSATNILDMQTVISDGNLEILTTIAVITTYTVFVTVNGVAVDISTYEESGNIGIRFDTAPVVGDLIEYIITSGTVDTISKAVRQVIIYDGSTSTYTLSTAPAISQPFEPNVIVQVGDKLLHGPDFMYYEVVGNVRKYQLPMRKYADNTIDSSDIDVYLNGSKLLLTRDYTWTTSLNELKLQRGVAKAGDNVVIEIHKNSGYLIHYNTNNSVELELTDNYSAGETICVTTFANHNILGIERKLENTKTESELVAETAEYYTFNDATIGRFKLRTPVINENYVWVALNDKILTPNVDFILEDNREFIKLSSLLNVIDTDIVDILTFGVSVGTASYGYKIFKDMLNRTTYKKANRLTTLAQALGTYDTSIRVVDGSHLSDPISAQHIPGVVFINGERIEYFIKNGNVLSQLRRGTLGTGVKSSHAVGSEVSNQSISEQIPYKDEVISFVTVITSNSTQYISIDFTPLVSDKTIISGNNWFRKTIPTSYGQCNEIEVFVGGRRLRKAPTVEWNIENGPDSPSGDSQVEAEFSVNGLTNQVRLTAMPAEGTEVRIYKRIGKMWTPFGTSISEADTIQADFIKEKYR